ncbi:MAG: hypothetical protein R6U44_01505 [Archaeoglobaceae archaeon]
MWKKDKEKERLSKFSCPEEDDLDTSGALLSDEIEHYANKFNMIYPFNPNNLKPASYELTVGDEYAKGGKIQKLYNETGKNEIKIEPFQVVVIKTHETINLPRFIIARWNIRVRWAYRGLLWVGGPQVDPGWVGNLSCPIYNLSNKDIILRLGDPIAIMDFVKTTPFKNDNEKYDRPPSRVIFEDYEPETLESALWTETRERMHDVENQVNKFERNLEYFIGISFTIITVIFAAMAIFVSSGQQSATQGAVNFVSWWNYVVIGFSIVAIALSIITLNIAKKAERRVGEK